jgi:hypothetical protein
MNWGKNIEFERLNLFFFKKIDRKILFAELSYLLVSLIELRESAELGISLIF